MQFKLISSLEKCFLDESILAKKEYKKGSMLKNEVFHFCIAYCSDIPDSKEYVYLSVESPIKEYVEVNRIEMAPVQYAAPQIADDYLRTSAGLYPDILQPLEPNGRLAVPYALKSLMVEVNTKGTVKSGEYPITFIFKENTAEAKKHSITFTLEIIEATLPEQELIYTQWFYCDCLQQYYKTDCFDEKHWKIIENFMCTAVKYGVNMMLTPIFTPPLDTAIGGERPTIQLVGVKVQNGEYQFDFSLLKRWIDLCKKVGIKYFEISHLFSQWGAKYAPKIMTSVQGEYKQLFGWKTEAVSKEYKEFLNSFIPELLDFLKKNGIDKNSYFHISDEPNSKNLENYRAAKNAVAELLQGYPIIDALSDYEFYRDGVCDRPIPTTDTIEDFIRNGVKELWTYYCGAQVTEVSNRFMAMPSYRNRIIGIQLYKYDIKGFLHWGYNYYFNRYSYTPVNPFMNTDGEFFVPAGDCFSVYPGEDGKPWPSIRMAVFYDALQDMRALKLCEQLYGKDIVHKLIDKYGEITFKNYPHNADYILEMREKINALIKNADIEES